MITHMGMATTKGRDFTEKSVLLKLMIKVATLYYKEKLKQESVARRLDISKYKVNRVLKEALKEGIVQIMIIKN